MSTDQQLRLVKAFCNSSTLCCQDCSCGRVHFVSCSGHGDYSPGELEELQRLAKEQPDKYIEEPDFDSIDFISIDGQQLVPDCPCKRAEKYAVFIERHAEPLADYLLRFFQERLIEAKMKAATAEQITTALAACKKAIDDLPKPASGRRMFDFSGG